jgi:N-acetylglucosaminyldiphosphoundecaprenol N-acetyl-beta-D-mannosaminyltransferase
VKDPVEYDPGPFGHESSASTPFVDSMAQKIIPRVSVLGLPVSAINMEVAVDTIVGWIQRRELWYVCVTGVHGVMECQRDARLKMIHDAAGLVTPDGMPLVWICRLLGLKNVRRVYGPDLMLRLSEESLRGGYSHYYYGGGPGITSRLAARLRARYPGLRVSGVWAPPFGPLSAEEDQAVVDSINASNADIVWIGLSTPKQEYWMAEHRPRLNAPVLIGVGAAFDFHAGTKPQAPRWMQTSGLEWFFRLITEPRRLGRRYLVNNSMFILRVLQALIRAKHGGEEGGIGIIR